MKKLGISILLCLAANILTAQNIDYRVSSLLKYWQHYITIVTPYFDDSTCSAKDELVSLLHEIDSVKYDSLLNSFVHQDTSDIHYFVFSIENDGEVPEAYLKMFRVSKSYTEMLVYSIYEKEVYRSLVFEDIKCEKLEKFLFSKACSSCSCFNGVPKIVSKIVNQKIVITRLAW